MQLYSSEALLLDVVDLHDYDRIVTFLTRERGLKRGVARGARRKYSRFGGQLQPLSKVRITWFEKGERELVRISSLEIERPASPLQRDLEGLLLGAYLADHVMEFAQENEDSELLYRLLDSTLRHLVDGVDRTLATRYFEAWVLRLAGVFPAPRECPECGRPFAGGKVVLPAAGETLVCAECGGTGAREVAPQVLETLLRIGGEDLPSLARRPPSARSLVGVEWVCREVRRRFLQHELKSYEVIRETLAGVGGAEPADAPPVPRR